MTEQEHPATPVRGEVWWRCYVFVQEGEPLISWAEYKITQVREKDFWAQIMKNGRGFQEMRFFIGRSSIYPSKIEALLRAETDWIDVVGQRKVALEDAKQALNLIDAQIKSICSENKGKH